MCDSVRLDQVGESPSQRDQYYASSLSWAAAARFICSMVSAKASPIRAKILAHPR